MSAPNTDPEKQVRQHRWPLIGMAVIVLIVLAGFVWWLNDETHDPEMPPQAPVEEITTPADTATTEPAAITDEVPIPEEGAGTD